MLTATCVIVDTSALIAVLLREPHFETIAECLLSAKGIIPSPVLVEYWRVAMGRSNAQSETIQQLIDILLAGDIAIAAFDPSSAEAAVAANPRYGSGNGGGGKLNMLDLMVYGMAKTTGQPILCTGKDFAATDALIHPASRMD